MLAEDVETVAVIKPVHLRLKFGNGKRRVNVFQKAV